MPDERGRPSQAAVGVTLPEELSHWLWGQKSGVPAGFCLLIAEEIRKNGQNRTRPLRQRWLSEQLRKSDTTIRTAMRQLQEIGALFSREEREGFVFWFGKRFKMPTGPPRPETAEAPMPGALPPVSLKSDVERREAEDIQTFHNQSGRRRSGQSHCSTKRE